MLRIINFTFLICYPSEKIKEKCLTSLTEQYVSQIIRNKSSETIPSKNGMSLSP